MLQTLGDILQMLYGGRYIILMMGIYSFYLGLIYNEFFSMPVIIFGRTKFKCFHADGSEILNDAGQPITNSIDPRDCSMVYGWVYGGVEGEGEGKGVGKGGGTGARGRAWVWAYG